MWPFPLTSSSAGGLIVPVLGMGAGTGVGVGLEAEGGASRGGEGAVRGRPMSGESRKGSGKWELGKNKSLGLAEHTS